MLNSSFGVGYGPTWLSNLDCQGNEERIMDCLTSRNTLLGNPACSKEHQAGVICEDGEEGMFFCKAFFLMFKLGQWPDW